MFLVHAEMFLTDGPGCCTGKKHKSTAAADRFMAAPEEALTRIAVCIKPPHIT